MVKRLLEGETVSDEKKALQQSTCMQEHLASALAAFSFLQSNADRCLVISLLQLVVGQLDVWRSSSSFPSSPVCVLESVGCAKNQKKAIFSMHCLMSFLNSCCRCLEDSDDLVVKY